MSIWRARIKALTTLTNPRFPFRSPTVRYWRDLYKSNPGRPAEHHLRPYQLPGRAPVAPTGFSRGRPQYRSDQNRVGPDDHGAVGRNQPPAVLPPQPRARDERYPGRFPHPSGVRGARTRLHRRPPQLGPRRRPGRAVRTVRPPPTNASTPAPPRTGTGGWTAL